MAGNYAVIKVGANTSEFTKASKKMTADWKLINSEMKANEAEAKAVGNADAALESKKKSLTQAINLQNTQLTNQTNYIKTLEQRLQAQKTTQSDLEQKVESTTAAYKKAVATYGENSTEAKKLESTLDKLKNTQKNTENAVEGTESAINKAKTGFNKMRVEVAKSEQALADVNKEFSTSKLEQYSQTLEKVSEKSGKIADGLGKVSIVGAGAMTMVGKLAYDANNDMTVLQAKLGKTAEETEALTKVARNVYDAGYGESITDCSDALSNMQRDIRETTNMTDEQRQSMLNQIMAVQELFNAESSEITRTVKVMQNSGLVESAQEALDIITYGFQNGGDYSGELLDTLREYSPQFQKLGLDGKTAMAYLIQGAENGAFNLDKVADAMKEFSIRAIDGSKTTVEGFQAIGLNADEMAAKFGAGGESAKVAFREVLQGLKNIDDPVAQSTAGVNLFGTMWEDLGPQVVLSLADIEGGIEGVEGTTQKAVDTLNQSDAKQFTSTLREAKDALIPLGTEALKLAKVILPPLKEIIEKAADTLEGMSDGEKKALATLLLLAPAGSAAAKGISIFAGGAKNAVGGVKFLVEHGGNLIAKLKGVEKAAPAAAGGVSKLAGGMKALVPSLGGASTGAAGTALSVAGMGAAVITAGVALGTGVAALYKYGEHQRFVKDGSQAIIDKNTELRASTEATAQTVTESIEARKQSIQAATQEVESTKSLTEQLYQLQSHYDGSTASQQAMQGTIDMLNQAIPGLNLSFDSQTGALNRNKEEIYNTINAYEERIKKESEWAALNDNITQRTQAEKEYQEAVAEGNRISDEKKRILDDIIAKYPNYNSNQQEYNRALEEYIWKTDGLNKAQDENNKAVEEAAGSVNKLRSENAEMVSQLTGEAVQAFERVPEYASSSSSKAVDSFLGGFTGRQAETFEKAHGLGRDTGNNIKNGYESTNEEFKTAVYNGLLGGVLKAGETRQDYNQAGQNSGQELTGGFGSKAGMFAGQADIIAQSGANNINAKAGEYWNAGNNVGTNVNSGFGSKTGMFGGTATNMAQTGVNAFGGFYSQMKNKGADGGRGVADGVGGQVGNVDNQFGRMKSVFDVSMPRPRIPLPVVHVSGGFSLNPPRVPHFSAGIEWFSSGGIFNKRSIIGVGDANNGVGDSPEAVVPLNQMYNRIEAIFRNVNHETRQTPQNTTAAEKMAITIPIQIGNKALEAYIIEVTGSNLAMTKRRVR